MKKIVFALMLALPLATSAFAADENKPMTAQQNKMGECNKEASEKQLKGAERKQFMSGCLKNKQKAQQEKMKTCNKDASDKKLKGSERKQFMSECLRAS
jgi:uncharacterized protein HemX